MIITINAGSSTIKLALFDIKHDQIVERYREEHSIKENALTLLKKFARKIENKISELVIAHRIVHAGPNIFSSQIIDESVEKEIHHAGDFAPLHNPKTLKLIHVCRQVFGPKAKQVAIIDSAFFANLPNYASSYALAKDICQKYGIRRLGFHGIAHRSLWRQFCSKRPRLQHNKLITLQLGAGSSIAAIKDGQPIDTSMGFTPLEGLVMSTRSGDIDPGILIYLMRQGFDISSLDDLLFNKSGLLGMSGISGNVNELNSSDIESAKLALEVYIYKAKKYVGSYLAALSFADGIVFGGGVGENAPKIRQKIIDGFEWCGIVLDKVKNEQAEQPIKISSDKSKVDIWVISPDEAFEMALEVKSLIWR